MNEEYQERIDNYLLGRLSDVERLAFEQDLEKDAELKGQYEYTKVVKDALMVENIENTIKKWNQAYNEEKEQNKSKQVSIRKNLYWISGIAAVFIVGFFIGHTFQMSEELAMPEAIPSYHSVHESSRGTESMEDDAVQMIDEGDYDLALNILEEQEDALNNEMEKNEDKWSSSSMTQEEYKVEQENLKRKIDRVLWLKSQALLGKAVSLLDSIRHSESDYQEYADSLYNSLNDILK